MATAESVKEKILGLIDQSNAATGNADADLTAAVGSLIAGFGQGGGGMESGEITVTNYYTFTIPVTSKKTHMVLWPKTIADAMVNHVTGGRTYGVLAIEGDGHVQFSFNNEAGTGLVRGDTYWYDATTNNQGRTIFNDTTIEVYIGYAPISKADYLWAAW